VTGDGARPVEITRPHFELATPQRAVDMPTNNFYGIPAGPYTFVAHSSAAMTRMLSSARNTLTTEVIARTLRNRLVADGVELAEEWDEPD
jgi:hypothetical protein